MAARMPNCQPTRLCWRGRAWDMERTILLRRRSLPGASKEGAAMSAKAKAEMLRDVARTGMELAAIRKQIKALRKKCVTFVCDYEEGPRAPWELSPAYDKKYWPCWKADYQDCGDGTLEPVTAAQMREQDTWCDSCLAREPVRKELSAMRAKHPRAAAAHWRLIVKAHAVCQ